MIQIRFDGPPGHTAGRFVEVEDRNGASIGVGRWVQDGTDWLLVIDDYEPEFYKCGHQRAAGGIEQHDCKD